MTATAETNTGLTGAEVEQWRARGQTNDVPDPTSRTYGEIIRANVFTRFNALLGVLLIAIIAVKEYRDGLFGIVLVLNTLIGIVQESRSKRTLDRLTVLSAPRATVRRDGEKVQVATSELVLDDVVLLSPACPGLFSMYMDEGKGFASLVRGLGKR